MAKDRTVTVTIIGDAKSLAAATTSAAKSLDTLEKQAGTSGSKMAGAFKGGIESSVKGLTDRLGPLGAAFEGLSPGAVAAGAALGGATIALSASVNAAQDADVAFRKVDAVIRATGGAAGVTAKQVDELARSIALKTGVDDEQIMKGQAVILTFKNIKDAAGAGNDVFTRATKAMVDLGTVFGSTDSAATMLGKALNDPVAGISALGEAGVTFTQQQKDAIRAMVESNDVLGAQKLILKEVESQVGGTAEASATASDKFKAALEDLEEELGKGLLPVINSAVGGLTKLVGALNAATESSGKMQRAAASAQAWEDNITHAADATKLLGSSIPILTNVTAELGTEFEKSSKFALAFGSALRTAGKDAEFAVNAQRIHIEILKDGAQADADAIKRQMDRISSDRDEVDAQKAITDAQRGIRDAQVQGARDIRDAQESLNDTRKRSIDLAKIVKDAESDLKTAHLDAYNATQNRIFAEQALNDAFKPMPPNLKAIEDAEKSLASARSAAESAAKAQTRAQEDLNEAQADLADGQLNDGQRAEKALTKARRDLERATLDVGAKEEDRRQRMAAGKVHEADVRRMELDIQDAYDRVADASDRVRKAEEARGKVGEVLAQKAKTVKDKADELKKANDDVAKATDGVSAAENTLVAERQGRLPSQEEMQKRVDNLKKALDDEKTATGNVSGAEDALAKARAGQAANIDAIAKAEEALGTARKIADQNAAGARDALTKAHERWRDLILSKEYADALARVDNVSPPRNTTLPTSGAGANSGGVAPGSPTAAVKNAIAAEAAKYIGLDEAGANSIFNKGSLLAGQDPFEAWCQTFVNAVLVKSGQILLKGADTPSTLTDFAAYKKAGRTVSGTQAAAGDLVYKQRYDSKGNVIGGHVGIIESIDKDNLHVTIIEGNAGDKVQRRTSKWSEWDLGIVHPGGGAGALRPGDPGYMKSIGNYNPDFMGLDLEGPLGSAIDDSELTDIETAALNELKKQGRDAAEWPKALQKNGGDMRAAIDSLGLNLGTLLSSMLQSLARSGVGGPGGVGGVLPGGTPGGAAINLTHPLDFYLTPPGTSGNQDRRSGGGSPTGGNYHDWVQDSDGNWHDRNAGDAWAIENDRKNREREAQQLILNLTVQGSVVAERDLVDTIRTSLADQARRGF